MLRELDFRGERLARKVSDIQCTSVLLTYKIKTDCLTKNKSSNKNKKTANQGQRFKNQFECMSNNKQETIKLLEKYKRVLKDVKLDQQAGWVERYSASCPNHEMHNSGVHNHKLVIGIMEATKRPDKFGKYVMTYYCNAYGDPKTSGCCSNKKLTELFSKRYKLGSGNLISAAEIEPQIFPFHDQSYKSIKGYNNKTKFFDYNGFTEQEIFFSRAKVIQPSGKEFYPICYSIVPDHFEYPDIKGDGTWVPRMLWTPPFPPYQLFKSTKLWQKENDVNFKRAIIHEGEEKSLVAQKLIPDSWNTSLYCAKTKWQQAWFDVFEKFDEVIVVPDNDADGRKQFKELTLYLCQLGINAKYVKLPSQELPNAWDIKDGFEGTKFTIDDYKQWIDEATTPKKRENKDDYSDLEEDASSNRWVHLNVDRKFHYDKHLREIVHNENINLWYKNDVETKDHRNRIVPNAVNYLHEVGCEIVEGLAYRPVDQEYLYEGKKKYVNSYIPYKPVEITEEEYDETILEPFFHQVKILTNFDQEAFEFFLDKIACTIQRPDINIQFATLIVSESEGTGKTSLWRCITDIHGGVDYVAWIRSRDVFHQFRPWMADRSIVIVNEVRIEGNEREKIKLVDNLKELITDEIHTVEKKNINPFQVKNEFTLFMSSNHDTLGVVRKKDGRRYFVLECLMTRQEINQKFPTHFKNFRDLSMDKDKLKHLRYFFKYKHKISEYFLKKGFFEPLETVAKENMAKASQSQLYNNLDELLYDSKSPFKFDVVNTREVYERLQSIDRDSGSKTWQEADEETLRSYFKDRGRILNKGNDIPNMRGRGERSRGWWTIRNQEFWLEAKPMQLRLHLKGELVAPLFREKQEEMFEEILNDTNVSNSETQQQRINSNG